MNSTKEIKELVEKYPFLLPRNVGTDEEVEDYDYSGCLFKDEIPQGWGKRGGLAYLDDLKEVLEKYNYVDKFRFSQIKEKFGSLRAYNFGQPKEGDNHELAWEYISKHTCIKCGKFPAPLIDDGWVSPWCNSCNNSKHRLLEDASRLQEYLIISHYKDNIKHEEFIDMKPFYDKIGWEYSDNDLILKDELLKIREEKENGKK